MIVAAWTIGCAGSAILLLGSTKVRTCGQNICHSMQSEFNLVFITYSLSILSLPLSLPVSVTLYIIIITLASSPSSFRFCLFSTTFCHLFFTLLFSSPHLPSIHAQITHTHTHTHIHTHTHTNTHTNTHLLVDAFRDSPTHYGDLVHQHIYCARNADLGCLH